MADGARLDDGDWTAEDVVEDGDEAERRENDVRRFMPDRRAVIAWKREDCMAATELR